MNMNVPHSATNGSRRWFMRRSLQAGVGLIGAATATTAYGFWEASAVRVRPQEIVLPNLPEAFDGRTVAVLTDLHHGPYVGLPFLRGVVERTNALKPDMIALVGDFSHKGTHTNEQLAPCLDVMNDLHAPHGVFTVPGNHDMQQRGRIYRDAIKQTTLCDVTNRAEPVRREGQTLWFAGVDDLWYGVPDQERALQGIPTQSAIILLSHNPDFAELNPDPRVGLVLSGHTHGGQAYLPVIGAPWMPTRYGDKYRHGLVEGPASAVFVSRGIGEAGVPVRLDNPPEINLLTLKRPATS